MGLEGMGGAACEGKGGAPMGLEGMRGAACEDRPLVVCAWRKRPASVVLPHMKETGKGQMVFVSSVAGLRKFARCSVYGASKWAVQGIAGSLREECRGTGVKIASLCPGSVATPWWLERDRGGKDIPATPEQLEKMLTVDDVAAACMSIITQSKSADTESIVLEPPPASMS